MFHSGDVNDLEIVYERPFFEFPDPWVLHILQVLIVKNFNQWFMVD